MKLGKLGQIQALSNMRRYVSGFHLWMACTLCALLIVSSLANKLLITGTSQARTALGNGQRVIYHIASSEVEGTPRHTKKEIVDPVEAAMSAPVVGKGGATVSETFSGNEGLAPAPLDTITEQTDKGLVPTAGHDGTLPWKYYARPFTPKTPRPIVAILFTNLGLSKPLTEDVLKMPHDFTLSFSPYSGDAKSWARKARGTGFESLIDLPMEPTNFPVSDPGPYGLLSTLEPGELSSRMHWILSRYPGFVGTLATADEKMTSNLSVMRSVLTELTARGVLFIYKKTPKNAELAELVKKQSLLAIGADTTIDDDLAPAAISKKLEELNKQAKANGFAIGIAHAYPTTLRALQIWKEDLDAAGIDLAPVSAIGKKAFP